LSLILQLKLAFDSVFEAFTKAYIKAINNEI